MPKLSILVPLLDSETLSDKLINTILSQTFKDFECIILCNKDVKLSTDDNRIKTIKVNIENILDLLNRGISESTGDWITFASPSSYFSLNCYKQSLNFESQADIIHFGMWVSINGIKSFNKGSEVMNDGLGTFEQKTENPACSGYFDNIWNKIIKKSLVEKVLFNRDSKTPFIDFNYYTLRESKNVYDIQKKLVQINLNNKVPDRTDTIIARIKTLKDTPIPNTKPTNNTTVDVKQQTPMSLENITKQEEPIKPKVEVKIMGPEFKINKGLSTKIMSTQLKPIISKRPKISIIVPVYNTEKDLFRCLNSIKNQDLQDWECIVIDDGSSDHSFAICEAMSVLDNRFKVIHKYNSGPAETRNVGIYLAKGEWISFVDSDDWIEPERYTIAIQEADKNNVDIVQCSVKVLKPNSEDQKTWRLGVAGEVYDTSFDGLVYTDYNYDIGHCWDKIYRASLLKDNNIFFPTCDLFEDTLFNSKAFYTSGKILSIGELLYNYVINTGSLAHSDINGIRKTEIINTAENVISNYLPTNANKDLIKGFFAKNIDRRCSNMIDYVFPYVDNNDPIWQKSFNTAKGISEDELTNGNIRFRSGEELLKYKFRAIEKWMPWVGTIHMIVSNVEQVPDWIDKSKVHIVLHSDYIPQEYLPTFNSCTIEMFLQNIFGLSEKFIYSNDDMYPNYKLVPKFFFENGKLKSNLFNRKLYNSEDINKVWAKIPINSLKLAAKDKQSYIDKYVDGKHLYELQHIGKPMFKSVNKKVFELYKNEIEESISQFREDKNLNQYLFTEYALFHELGSFETFRFKYFVIKPSTVDEICKNITEPNEQLRMRSICCNDGELATDEMFSQIAEAFEKEYPNKSKYEV